MSLLGALASSSHIWTGLTNPSLRCLVAQHLGSSYSSRQMTYDLRRLRRKGFIERIDGTHRYRLTPHGRALSMFFSKVFARIVTPGLAHLDPSVPTSIAQRSSLGRAWHELDLRIDEMVAATAIAA